MTNKLKYFVGNWKMFGDFGSVKIIHKIQSYCNSHKNKGLRNKVIFCLPHTLISSFSKKFKSKIISIGAQNCSHHQNFGPFTGSVSALMIKKAGAKFVILGHSENRIEGDTKKIIKKKILSALSQKLNIIFCIGETYKEKIKGQTFSVLRNQMKTSLVRNQSLKNIVIAYEPVWSIGTGKIPNVQAIGDTLIFIKREFKKIFRTTKAPAVLYGGSVNDKNINKFSSISQIDGFLIGGASQSSKKFIDIMKNYYK